MNEAPTGFLKKAERALRASKRLLEEGDTDFASSRAYYAMFYAVQALLISQGLTSKKHSGAHSAFGELFAKAGKLDPKYHRWLLDAFDQRLQGDYGFEAVLTVEDVERTIQQADEFLQACRRQLR